MSPSTSGTRTGRRTSITKLQTVGREEIAVKRIAMSALAAAGVLLAGCGHSGPTEAQQARSAAQVKQLMGAKATTGAAPMARPAPPGVAIGDHRGGLAGGVIPGVSRK